MSNPTEPSKEVPQATPSKNTELQDVLTNLILHASRGEDISPEIEQLQALLDQEYKRGRIEALESLKAVWSPYVWNLGPEANTNGLYSFARSIDNQIYELKKTRGTE